MLGRFRGSMFFHPPQLMHSVGERGICLLSKSSAQGGYPFHWCRESSSVHSCLVHDCSQFYQHGISLCVCSFNCNHFIRTCTGTAVALTGHLNGTCLVRVLFPLFFLTSRFPARELLWRVGLPAARSSSSISDMFISFSFDSMIPSLNLIQSFSFPSARFRASSITSW